VRCRYCFVSARAVKHTHTHTHSEACDGREACMRKQRSHLEVAQGALASLSVELYDRMKQAAHKNFETALQFLDPLGWMWQHGLAQHLDQVQDRDQGARPHAQASASQEPEWPRPRSAQAHNPHLAGSRRLDFLIVDAGPDARADLPNAARPALGVCVRPSTHNTLRSMVCSQSCLGVEPSCAAVCRRGEPAACGFSAVGPAAPACS
jgi:hypothetical protein